MRLKINSASKLIKINCKINFFTFSCKNITFFTFLSIFPIFF